MDDRRTDQQLIASANRGDAAAFDVLYRRYRDWVVSLAFRFTDHRDDALDIMQDTFIHLLGRFPGFVLTCQLKTFLYPIVRNLAVQRRRKRKPAFIDEELLDALPASATQVETSNNADLIQLLQMLPAAQREVLIMRFVDGLSLADIAAALSIPQGTVKSRFHHAINTLRDDPRTRSYFDQ